jgi:hypothetical protein
LWEESDDLIAEACRDGAITLSFVAFMNAPALEPGASAGRRGPGHKVTGPQDAAATQCGTMDQPIGIVALGIVQNFRVPQVIKNVP